MGAWLHLARPLGLRRPYEIRWDYIGRPPRASPSEGSAGSHRIEQERIITAALAASPILAARDSEIDRGQDRAIGNGKLQRPGCEATGRAIPVCGAGCRIRISGHVGHQRGCLASQGETTMKTDDERYRGSNPQVRRAEHTSLQPSHRRLRLRCAGRSPGSRVKASGRPSQSHRDQWPIALRSPLTVAGAAADLPNRASPHSR